MALLVTAGLQLSLRIMGTVGQSSETTYYWSYIEVVRRRRLSITLKVFVDLQNVIEYRISWIVKLQPSNKSFPADLPICTHTFNRLHCAMNSLSVVQRYTVPTCRWSSAILRSSDCDEMKNSPHSSLIETRIVPLPSNSHSSLNLSCCLCVILL